MDDETYPFGPASDNMFRRLSAPPALDKRQSRPLSTDPNDGDRDDRDVTVGHATLFKDKRLYVTTEERQQILRNTPGPLKQMIHDAHITGPVPPHIEAIRNRTGNALRYGRAQDYLRAEFHSDDVPDGFTLGAYACLQPLVVGEDSEENPAAVGSSDTWCAQSCRTDALAKKIGQCAVHLARHCSDYARSSGGWVYFGDLVQKIKDDGCTFQSCALAAHSLVALPPGTV
eukprot:968030-Pyramimonas_sp.AAC.1